jgi:hypothetical protein
MKMAAISRRKSTEILLLNTIRTFSRDVDAEDF